MCSNCSNLGDVMFNHYDAELRADTTMDKALLSAQVKLQSDKMKAKDVRTLKGPKS